ncbi:MAG TPA: hypothetical protein VHH36_02135, partial [Candidatus Thermoplasmatota archaeon]|nr:hypothetical protein [Candidatus Thermoplasmatota archaeon]
AGVALAHLALAVALLGYAASTYASDQALLAAAAPGDAAEAGGRAFVLAPASPRLDAQGRLDAIDAALALDGDGAIPVRFEWTGAPGEHYAGRLAVRRTLAEDVYVSPLAFRTADGWVSSNGPSMAKLDPSGVEAVSVRVTVLPLVGLVWAGLALLLLAMGMVLAGTLWEGSRARAASPAR